jgi:8-oxo-dGTP pyrophosphatase MutT (NUDIX family)
LINEQHEILLADEQMFNKRFTKFPGGGLESGEGTLECLKRECLEEMNQQIKDVQHFYTTDFFQPSYFHKGKQIISIYYTFQIDGEQRFKTVTKPFENTENQDDDFEVFRWKKIAKLSKQDLTFPIDQHVVQLIKQQY